MKNITTNKQNNNPILSDEDSKSCSICKQLLDNLGQFFALLDSVRKVSTDEWLTVEEVAKELKISKSIVYRIIRNGELEAVNIVDRSGIKNVEERKTFTFKGHYRIKKTSLTDYLQKKIVQPPVSSPRRNLIRKFPKVKNHLGL